jgi:ADP-heptose:LPS heptosyltransferase
MRGSKLYRRLDTLGGMAAAALLSALPTGAPPRLDAGFRPRRILVTKLAALGDVVLLIPALRALRERWPDAEVGMVGTAVTREVAGLLPHLVDRFLCLEPGRAARDPRYLLRFAADLRAGGWDVAVDFDQWTFATAVLLRLARVPARVGFRTRTPLRHRLYTHVRPRDSRGVHEAANFMRLLEPLGIARGELVPSLPVDPARVPAARARLADGGWNEVDLVVLVHPGCGHAHPRAWPVERYRELCGRLADAEPVFFAFTGAGAESAFTKELAASVPGRGVALDSLPLADLLAQLSLAGLVVSGNTGVMHLAAALSLPQVVLEGPNDPAKWGPLNRNAVIVRSTCPECPCLDRGWEFHRTDGFCMAQIGVDEVLRAALGALHREEPCLAGAAD